MKYSTVVVAAFVVTGLLFAGAMTGTAKHEEEFGGTDTFTLEVGTVGGDGQTCLYNEGPHMNRIEISDGELGDLKIYNEGEAPMQINFKKATLNVVLWTNGSNDAVDAAATANGTCIENNYENVTLDVLLLHTDIEGPEGVEIETGDDVEEPPPPGVGTGLAPTEDDVNDTVENVNDTVNDITDGNITGVGNLTDDNLTDVGDLPDDNLTDDIIGNLSDVGNLTDDNLTDVGNLTDDNLTATDEPIDPAEGLITHVFASAGEAVAADADDETTTHSTTDNEVSEG